MAKTNFSTWFKLCMGIVSTGVGLFAVQAAVALMQPAFPRGSSPFLGPNVSFLALVAISIVIYALILWMVRKFSSRKIE